MPGRWMLTHKAPAALWGCPGNPQRWPSWRDATAHCQHQIPLGSFQTWGTCEKLVSIYLGSHAERNTQRPTVTKLAPGPEPRSHKIAVHKYSPWDHLLPFGTGGSVSVGARRWQLVWMVCLESFPFSNRQSRLRLTCRTKLRRVAERLLSPVPPLLL